MSTRCSLKHILHWNHTLFKNVRWMSIFSRVANILPSQAVHAFHVPELIKHFFGLEMIVQASGVPRSTRLKYCYCNILTLGLMSWYSSIFCQISKTPFSSGVIVKAARSTYNSMSCTWGIHCNLGCNFLEHLCIRIIFWFHWLALILFSLYIHISNINHWINCYISKSWYSFL